MENDVLNKISELEANKDVVGLEDIKMRLGNRRNHRNIGVNRIFEPCEGLASPVRGLNNRMVIAFGRCGNGDGGRIHTAAEAQDAALAALGQGGVHHIGEGQPQRCDARHHPQFGGISQVGNGLDRSRGDGGLQRDMGVGGHRDDGQGKHREISSLMHGLRGVERADEDLALSGPDDGAIFERFDRCVDGRGWGLKSAHMPNVLVKYAGQKMEQVHETPN